MTTYATPADLAADPWGITPTPSNAGRLLHFASTLVRRATLTATYDVDTAGTPTDAAVLAAFRDATCSQVATWLALTIDPAKGDADAGGAVASKSIGSASVQYAVYASTAEARARAATQLSQDAALILADAGLLGARPWTTR